MRPTDRTSGQATADAPQGWGRGKRGHDGAGRPSARDTPGYLACGQPGRDHRVAGLRAQGSAALWWNFGDHDRGTSPNLHLPLRPRLAPSALHLSPSFPRVFGGASAPLWLPCRPLVLRAPAHLGRALTSGTGKPFRVLPGVQPKGRESRSSYSAGSQRASALLAAPSAGFLLKPSKTRAQPRPGRCGLGFSAKPVEPGAAAVGASRGKGGAEERPLECGVSELRPPRRRGAALPVGYRGPFRRCGSSGEGSSRTVSGGAAGAGGSGSGGSAWNTQAAKPPAGQERVGWAWPSGGAVPHTCPCPLTCYYSLL